MHNDLWDKEENMRTDKERLDWLEDHAFGEALVSDDNGHWALSNGGFQNAVCGKKPKDVWTNHMIEAKSWSSSIRKAIDKAMDEE